MPDGVEFFEVSDTFPDSLGKRSAALLSDLTCSRLQY